jgi:hypothetical protein
VAKDNFEAASSALYHIEAIERRLKMLKQMINPQTGAVTDSQVMAGLANSIEYEIIDLRDDLIRFL